MRLLLAHSNWRKPPQWCRCTTASAFSFMLLIAVICAQIPTIANPQLAQKTGLLPFRISTSSKPAAASETVRQVQSKGRTARTAGMHVMAARQCIQKAVACSLPSDGPGLRASDASPGR